MSDSRQFVFGPGVAFCKIAQYLDGTAAVLAQPSRFDVLQDFSLDFSFTTKELFGNNVFPEAIGVGNTKLSGKIRSARINAQMLVSSTFGYPNQPTTGVNLLALSEAGTVPGVSAYTVQVANHATFVKDWGVRYKSTGIYLAPVSTLTAAGQYTVDAGGTYTFDSADANAALMIDYEYSSASGKAISITNFLQGQITLYGIRYQGVFKGNNIGIWVPNAVSSKFAINPKQQDFTIPEFDFSAFAGADEQVATLYLTE